jgi:uncharacterized membrane protein YobD (UPF0266 family)
MKDTVIVRKNKGRRTGLRFFVVILILFLGILVLNAPGAYVDFAILCTPIVLSALALLAYFETWKLSLFPDKIIKQVLFITLFNFSYTQIKDVVASHSSTEYDHIRIVFLNGKQVLFRRDDDNAGMALTRLASHHSVRRM